MAEQLRRCRWCRHPLTPPGQAGISDRLRVAHCGNPACTWCANCVMTRTEAIKAGRADLLPDAGPPTQEIPTVRDDDTP